MSSGEQFSSLIDQIAERALDDDYYEVRPGRYSRARRPLTWRVGLVLLVFAFIVTAAAVQTRDSASLVQAQRSSLVSTIEARKRDIAAGQERVATLQTEVRHLKAEGELISDFAQAESLVGLLGISGPGVRIKITPAEGKFRVYDMQRVVNGLWEAGADALSINSHRLTALSAIRSANNAIVVNYRSLSPPFTILAIGDIEQVRDKFSDTDGGLLLAQRRQQGVDVQISTLDSAVMDAAPTNRVTLKYAKKGP